MFRSKTWKDAEEKLAWMQEEYDFIYKINEKRMFELKCNHKEKIYLKHLPHNQTWMMLCDTCGVFNPITCGHGGSGYCCPECIKKFAKEVIIL